MSENSDHSHSDSVLVHILCYV